MSTHEYTSLAKPIRDSELTDRPNDQNVDQRLAKLFLSLLMALAFCLQTRMDLAIYIVALRRYARSPTAEHIRKLNAIVLLAIKHPCKIMYCCVKCDRKLKADSDAELRCGGTEESDGGFSGRAVKGAIFVRWVTWKEGAKPVLGRVYPPP